MAVKQKYKESRVNTLPTTGLSAGDRYYLNVGGGKYQTYTVSDALQLVKEAGADFIEKDTMAQMRALSAREIWALQNGYYKGVRLNGYYTKGDTPASIDYYISSTSASDDGGSIIAVGGIKLEHVFIDNIYTEYFGLIIGMSPTEVFTTLQNLFNAGARYKVKNIYLQEGDFVVSTATTHLLYQIHNSNFYWKGSLKLADGAGRATGTLLIRYNANNVKVYDQKLDGNRDNNPIANTKGVQFNFSTYGFNNIQFIGGWSKNAALCHVQSTSENVSFTNMEFDTSGEHGLYLTLSPNQPLQRVTITNCVFRNYAIHLSGTGITVRDYRFALIDNCEFYPTDTPKPDGGGNIDSTINYDSVIAEGENVRHIIRNCKIYHNNSLSYSINGADDVSKNGTYIEGGYIEGTIINGVSIVGATLKNTNSLSTMRRIPKRIENCYIEDYRTIVPDEGFTFDLINNVFKRVNYPEDSQSLINIAQSPLTNGNINIINNTFDGFNLTSTVGLIRGKEGIKVNVVDNKLKNCGTVMFTRLSTQDTLINNSDISGSGVRSHFTVQPKIVANNDYIRVSGTTSERPSVVANIPLNHVYFNTTTGNTERFNGTAWTTITPNATSTVKGLVNQTSALANISQADLLATTSPVATVDIASTATDVAGLLTDLNDLISKYNVAVALINELKTKYDLNVTLTNAIKSSQNTELTNQRTAGQQAT